MWERQRRATRAPDARRSAFLIRFQPRDEGQVVEMPVVGYNRQSVTASYGCVDCIPRRQPRVGLEQGPGLIHVSGLHRQNFTHNPAEQVANLESLRTFGEVQIAVQDLLQHLHVGDGLEVSGRCASEPMN